MPMQHELIIGGVRSGKSRAAESRAAAWLAAGGGRSATLVATALPGELTGDDEMAQRIARHQADRARRIPRMQTVQAPSALGRTLRTLADPQRLIVVDCLTLWITQCLMPPAGPAGLAGAGGGAPAAEAWAQEQAELIGALRASASPVVLVSNEIGLGLLPMARELRAFVDALGRLHQAVADCCARVTLMVAGCALCVKGAGAAAGTPGSA